MTTATTWRLVPSEPDQDWTDAFAARGPRIGTFGATIRVVLATAPVPGVALVDELLAVRAALTFLPTSDAAVSGLDHIISKLSRGPGQIRARHPCPLSEHQSSSTSTARKLANSSPPISVTIPFVASAGTRGAVSLVHDRGCGDKAHLTIDMAMPTATPKAGAPLTVRQMQQLVDGLMDCIDTLERGDRLQSELSHDRV